MQRRAIFGPDRIAAEGGAVEPFAAVVLVKAADRVRVDRRVDVILPHRFAAGRVAHAVIDWPRHSLLSAYTYNMTR
jgi:hypothetical protein